MSMVVLKLPDVHHSTQERPKACPYCHGQTFQRWGKVRKPVKDHRIDAVEVYRYRCNRCGHTFRHYPEGVDRADQTQRMRKLAVICWVLGLSLRAVEIVLSAFGVRLSHMSVWRDMQEQAALLQKRRRWQGVRVLGVDGLYPLGWGKRQPVLIAVDLGDGQPVAIAHVEETNPQAVYRFLQPLVRRLGVRVVVTDDLGTFGTVAEKLGLKRQVCQFHVRRWVGRALRELRDKVPEEWLWVLDEVKHLLSELPPEGSRRLFELWKQVPERHTGQAGARSPLALLRNLLVHLSEHWGSYRLFAQQEAVPWTNNGTEQVICRMKMRSRTVRGYKSWSGMWAALLLSGSGVKW